MAHDYTSGPKFSSTWTPDSDDERAAPGISAVQNRSLIDNQSLSTYSYDPSRSGIGIRHFNEGSYADPPILSGIVHSSYSRVAIGISGQMYQNMLPSYYAAAPGLSGRVRMNTSACGDDNAAPSISDVARHTSFYEDRWVDWGIPDKQEDRGTELNEDRWDDLVVPDKQEHIVSCCEKANTSLKHSSHDNHELKLTHVLSNNSETFDRNCNGCLEKLTSSADPHYYYCSECDYSLHKLCATLPMQKHHPLHTKPHAALKLYDEPPHEFGQGKCKCCDETWSNFTYSCLECEIDIDIKCATVGEHKVTHWMHKHHELTLVHGEINMNCRFCGIDHKGSFFHCTACEKPNSYIHSQCAQYPIRLPFQCLPKPEHDHPLQLALESDASCGLCEKGISKGPRFTCIDTKCRYNQHLTCGTTEGTKHVHQLKYSEESEIPCNICEQDIPKGSTRYNCTEKCPYSVHIGCAIPPPTTNNEVANVDYEKSSDGVPNLPFPDNSYSLVKHHFSKLKIEAGVFNRLIHHHPLVPFNHAEDATLSSTAGLKKLIKKFKLICKLCGQLITDHSFYRCPEECCVNFLLHKWCANLPTTLKKAPCHTNHQLFLQPKYSQLFGSLGLFKCDVCRLWCDGFSYGCDECDFHVDMNCAFLLKNIMHKKHLHTLRLSPFFQTQKKLRKCDACSDTLNDGVFVYQCFKCDFFLHTECSLLPLQIRHRYDKHNYKLTFSLQPGELKYFCDICELQIDTKQWFYNCDICVQSAHAAFVDCIKPYNKVLRLIRIGNHPNGFSLVSKWQKVNCVVCKEPVSTLPFFKCSTCHCAVDSWCVPKMICYSTEDVPNSEIDTCLI